MVKNEYRLVFARDDKTKILFSSKANIEAKSCYYFINSKVCGLIIEVSSEYNLYFYAFFLQYTYHVWF